MKINKNCNLVLSDLFFYDIRACYYNLLINLGWDINDIEKDNKTTRNIQIGLLQKENPKLASYLLQTANQLIDYYIKKNKLKDDDIIVRQRDGLISTRPLLDNDSTLKLNYRGNILKLIINIERRMFLSIYDNKVEVKGVPNKPIDCSFYNMFKTLDFCNKKNLTRGLNGIRLTVLNSNNLEWFTFQKNEQYIIPIKNSGNINLTKLTLRYLDHDEVDKLTCWNNYIWPFVQPILLYCQ